MPLAMIERAKGPRDSLSLLSWEKKDEEVRESERKREKERGRKRRSQDARAARAIILLIKLNAANSKGRLINGVFA